MNGQHTAAYNGGIYTGAWRDGAPHGQGSLTWANSDKYKDAWLEGKPNRKGT